MEMQNNINQQQEMFEKSLITWRKKEKTALELLKIVGDLRFDRSIELIFFKRDIYDCRPSELIDIHTSGLDYTNAPISVDMSLSLAKSIQKLDLPPSRIDLGALAMNWLQEEGDYTADLDIYVRKALVAATPPDSNYHPKDVVLFGFGRIGRLLARRIVDQTAKGDQLRLRAIVIKPRLEANAATELAKRASLLKHDSVHGEFMGIVEIDAQNNQLIINGSRVQVIFASSLDEVDYAKYGIENALVIDNTGIWRNKEDMAKHLRAGVTKVLLTAPSPDAPNIVHGVNNEILDLANDQVVSAASCTTNAVVPILKVLQNAFGIEKAHIESIHAYTNSQNLLDNIHSKPRRGRSAPLNMVLTTTGAAEAAEKALPELHGKLTANAIRVPLPNVSLAIIHLSLSQVVSVLTVNETVKKASLHGDLADLIKYSTSIDHVSSDVVGSWAACVFDSPSTIVSTDGKSATVYVWYDNEFGYVCQVVRLAKYISEVRRLRYY